MEQREERRRIRYFRKNRNKKLRKRGLPTPPPLTPYFQIPNQSPHPSSQASLPPASPLNSQPHATPRVNLDFLEVLARSRKLLGSTASPTLTPTSDVQFHNQPVPPSSPVNLPLASYQATLPPHQPPSSISFASQGGASSIETGLDHLPHATPLSNLDCDTAHSGASTPILPGSQDHSHRNTRGTLLQKSAKFHTPQIEADVLTHRNKVHSDWDSDEDATEKTGGSYSLSSQSCDSPSVQGCAEYRYEYRSGNGKGMQEANVGTQQSLELGCLGIPQQPLRGFLTRDKSRNLKKRPVVIHIAPSVLVQKAPPKKKLEWSTAVHKVPLNSERCLLDPIVSLPATRDSTIESTRTIVLGTPIKKRPCIPTTLFYGVGS